MNCQTFKSIAENDEGLQLCYYFKMSSPNQITAMQKAEV